MVVLTKDIKVIKVPLPDKDRMPDYPARFHPVNKLYLELFENKAKIKQDLINKEYVRKEGAIREGAIREGAVTHMEQKNEHVERKAERGEHHKENLEIKEREDSKSNSSESISSSNSKSESKDSVKDSDRDKKPVKNGSETSSSSSSSSSSKSKKSESSKSESNDSSNLEDRLKELLKDKAVSSVSRSASKYTTYEKYKENVKPKTDTGRTEGRADANTAGFKTAPTLAELEATGKYQGKAELRNIDHIPKNEYEEEDEKRELIFQFSRLRKSYPTAQNIPEFTVHSDLREMRKTYDSTIKNLSLDSTVDTYKNYLIHGFMLSEFVFGSFLGFDMQGFTQQQILNMGQYEKLLIELGEKSYVPTGSRWPVELRLMFIILMNAGFFIVGKMIMKKTGADLMGMINNTAGMGQQNNTNTAQRPRRRMKGPNIDVDDLPEMSTVDKGGNGNQYGSNPNGVNPNLSKPNPNVAN
jgi:hypothetical protein